MGPFKKARKKQERKKCFLKGEREREIGSKIER